MITALCPRCGFNFPSRLINIAGFGNATVNIKNVRETCPRCGGLAEVKDGTYELLGSAVQALRTAEPAQLEQLQAIARAAAVGALTAVQAQQEAAAVRNGFGELVRLAMQWGVPSLLVAIVGLYLQWEVARSANADTETLIGELRRQSATNELILKELQKLSAPESKPPQLQSGPPKLPPILQKPISRVAPNRHERRKAKAVAKPDKA